LRQNSNQSERGDAHHEEHGSPAVADHHPAAEQRACRRTDQRAELHGRRRARALSCRDVSRQQAKRARVEGRLPGAHEEPQRDERGEPACEPHEPGRRAPKQETGRQHACGPEAVRAPAHDRLHGRVCPVKESEHPADFARGEVQLLAEEGCGDRDAAAIRVIDEEGDREEGNEPDRRAAARQGIGHPVSMDEISHLHAGFFDRFGALTVWAA
jgi:hypothetical protein